MDMVEGRGSRPVDIYVKHLGKFIYETVGLDGATGFSGLLVRTNYGDARLYLNKEEGKVYVSFQTQQNGEHATFDVSTGDMLVGSYDDITIVAMPQWTES